MRGALKLRVLLGFAGVIAAGVCGCSGAENAMDCSSICDQYQRCWDNNYDTSQCRSNCTDKANSDKDFERKVGMCSACIEDRSCGGSFLCAADCLGVVP